MSETVPLLVFTALLLTDMVGEYVAMLLTGALRRKHKREWTYAIVAYPFKGMAGMCLVEALHRPPHPSPWAVILGAILAGAGTAIRICGHVHLGRAFSPYVESCEDHRLIRTGMYSRVRHPMYTGSILLLIGLPLTAGALFAWFFTALGVIGILIRIPREEEFLIRELPGYREYMQHTGRLFPHL